MTSNLQMTDYPIEEISGSEYETLEQWQEQMLEPLARLLVDIFRQSPELFLAPKCDIIEPKTMEVTDV